jgi:mannitol-specific phosphotransferase system IIBC component
MLLGTNTLVALLAAAWLSIIISAMLLIVNHPGASKALENLTEKLNKIKNQVSKWLEERYQEQGEKDEATEEVRQL